MEKREKIIVALAGLAAVIGGGMMLMDSGTPSGPQIPAGPPPTAEIRQQIITALPKLAITPSERAEVLALNRPWRVDPLHTRVEKGAQADLLADDAPELLFRYTGFLEMGGSRLAIINGQEYQENEALDIVGFRLLRIYPNRVTIASEIRDSPIVIAYEETEGSN